jgi:hypothetical protein
MLVLWCWWLSGMVVWQLLAVGWWLGLVVGGWWLP